MPFNLRIEAISGPTWSTDVPAWLDTRSPPREPYEVIGPTYERDRYLLMSALDLFNWQGDAFERVRPRLTVAALDTWTEAAFSKLITKLAESRENDLFMLHWTECESGLG